MRERHDASSRRPSATPGRRAQVERHRQVDLALDQQFALEGERVECDRHRALDHVLDRHQAGVELGAFDRGDDLGDRPLWRCACTRREVVLRQQRLLGEGARAARSTRRFAPAKRRRDASGPRPPPLPAPARPDGTRRYRARQRRIASTDVSSRRPLCGPQCSPKPVEPSSIEDLEPAPPGSARRRRRARRERRLPLRPVAQERLRRHHARHRARPRGRRHGARGRRRGHQGEEGRPHHRLVHPGLRHLLVLPARLSRTCATTSSPS